MHYLFIFFQKTRLWTKNFHFLYIPQLFSRTKPETQKNSHSHQTKLVVPNPSIRKQENEIHPTKTQKKVTIITKKESRRKPEMITDEGSGSQPVMMRSCIMKCQSWITPESMDCRPELCLSFRLCFCFCFLLGRREKSEQQRTFTI